MDEGNNFCIQCGEYIGKKEIKFCEKFLCTSSSVSISSLIGSSLIGSSLRYFLIKLKNVKNLCKNKNEPDTNH